MKNKLLSLGNKLFSEKQKILKILNDPLNNLIQITHSRHRRVFKFLAYLIAGLLVFTLIAIYIIPQALPEKPYKTSWIGNTFGGGNKWVQNFIEAMYVAPDGTVYTNSEWDEAGREAGIYKDGDIISKASELHGWGRHGGAAVTANNQYLYVAMVQGNEGGGLTGENYPPKGTDWYCVRRYDLNGKPASFSGKFGDGSMLLVSKTGRVTGLATTANELFVSDYTANRIRVYDTQTMAELRSFAVAHPQQLTVDPQGNLWIIQHQATNLPAKILHYAKTGKQLPEQITEIVEPKAIAVDHQGRLLVAENGTRQQVLIYNIAGKPKQVGAFGTAEGIYSGTRGEIGDLKLYGITGVGTDTAGNIYVSNNGFGSSGTDLRKFDPNGKLQWRLLGLQFVDNADADPGTDGVDVFTKHEHFLMDYSKEKGQEGSYKGYTVDKFRYPDDPRLHNQGHSTASVFVRRIQGKRFLYITGMYANHLHVYRFDGEIAVPSAIFAKNHIKGDWPTNQPSTGSWLWHDKNGDGSIQSNEYESLGKGDDSIWGWEIDTKGDVWQASESGSIRHFRISGLDDFGSPIYSSDASETIPMPAPFNKLTRIKYFPEQDVMYLGGYTSDRPQPDGEWGRVGTEIVRYDNWSKIKKVKWRIPLADESKNVSTPFKAMDVAGDKIFAVTVKTAEVYVYDAATGDFVTKLTPGSEVERESGWVDTPYGLRAYRRANGEYVVFVEEVLKAKVIMYRLIIQK